MRSSSSRKCPSLLSLKQEMNATPACAINRDNTKHQSSNGLHRNNDPDVDWRKAKYSRDQLKNAAPARKKSVNLRNSLEKKLQPMLIKTLHGRW